LKILPFSEWINEVLPGDSLFVEDQSEYHHFFVEDIQPLGRFVLLRLQGYTTKSDVEPLVGRFIWKNKSNIDRDRKPGTYFTYELINLLVKEKNQDRGVVREVIEGPAYDYLQIQKDEKEYLLPFLRVFIQEINLQEGYITVDCPKGFWE